MTGGLALGVGGGEGDAGDGDGGVVAVLPPAADDAGRGFANDALQRVPVRSADVIKSFEQARLRRGRCSDAKSC